jgi:orotate phosphoribosyltransferase
MGLFQLGDFTLHSGAKSQWRIDCDRLSDDDIVCLAVMIQQMVGSFRSVEGVPRGGLLLAEALWAFQTTSGPHLIVDDVLTTGDSMEEARAECRLRGYGPGVAAPLPDPVGVVLFARGECPPWVKAVFQTPPDLWEK